jgi:hypothetical protein
MSDILKELCKDKRCLKKLALNKRSSLFCQRVNKGKEKFLHNKLECSPLERIFSQIFEFWRKAEKIRLSQTV